MLAAAEPPADDGARPAPPATGCCSSKGSAKDKGCCCCKVSPPHTGPLGSRIIGEGAAGRGWASSTPAQGGGGRSRYRSGF